MVQLCEGLLLLFALQLTSQVLTPVQERLSNTLEAAVGEYDLQQKILDRLGNADFIVFRRDPSHDAEQNVYSV